MKKWSVLQMLLICFLISLSFSCSKEQVEIAEVNQEKKFISEFQKGLKSFYGNVNGKIATTKDLQDIHLTSLFRESYTQIFAKNANLEMFDNSLDNLQSRSEYVNSTITQTIESAPSAEEAVEIFESLAQNENTSFEDKIEFIAMAETLRFISTNSDLIANMYFENEANATAAKCDGWWSCWGKCAAGIISGTIGGGLGGAASGSAVPAIGTVAGGIVGAVAGGLGGAAAAC